MATKPKLVKFFAPYRLYQFKYDVAPITREPIPLTPVHWPAELPVPFTLPSWAEVGVTAHAERPPPGVVRWTEYGLWIYGYDNPPRIASLQDLSFKQPQHLKYSTVLIDGKRQRVDGDMITIVYPNKLVAATMFYSVAPKQREPTIADLHEEGWLVSDESLVLRDLVMESSPRMWMANPHQCCAICRRRFDWAEWVVWFTVTMPNTFWKHCARPASPAGWGSEVHTDEKLGVGDDAKVHPHCIGLTLTP